MVSPRRLVLRRTAVLCLVAASCSSNGGATTTKASDASSTLPPPESAVAGVGDDDSAAAEARPVQPSAAPSGIGGPRPSATLPTPPPDTNRSATTTTTAASIGTTTTTVPPGLPPEKCPEPKTCRHYAFTSGAPLRYPAGADGRVTIEYWLNTTGLDTRTITVQQAESAIAAAFDTWQRAAPTLRFLYRGRTDRLGTPGDGVNVIAFNGTNSTSVGETNGRPEFDTQFAPHGWVWKPCDQRDGSCTPIGQSELQSIATHEAGHALWMGHVNDPRLDREMTMWPGDEQQIGNGRFWTTLALGDVLGIRTLYPCSCPLPPIYDP